MKCFTHRSVDAVGLCKICQKGVCESCAVDLGYALACRGACETEAAQIHSQVLTSRKLLAAQKRNRYLMPMFLGGMGLLFILSDAVSGRFSWFATGFGGLFMLLQWRSILPIDGGQGCPVPVVPNMRWSGGEVNKVPVVMLRCAVQLSR